MVDLDSTLQSSFQLGIIIPLSFGQCNVDSEMDAAFKLGLKPPPPSPPSQQSSKTKPKAKANIRFLYYTLFSLFLPHPFSFLIY